MSLTPLPPVVVDVQSGPYRLCSFDALKASLVAGWVHDPLELFRLAPKTLPPLTADKVIEWPGADGCPLMLTREQVASPLGYLELNPMPAQKGHFWLGHCVVDPDHRGQGLGVLMVSLMLDHAFHERRAERVSLVVFPDNTPALRCYRRVGFIVVGEQFKTFPTSSRHHRMLRMSIDRKRHDLYRPKTADC